MKKALLIILSLYSLSILAQENQDSTQYFEYLKSVHDDLIAGKEERIYSKKILADMQAYHKTAIQELDSVTRSLNVEKIKLVSFEESHFKKQEGLNHDLEDINSKTVSITKKEGIIALNKETSTILTPRKNSKKTELTRAQEELKEVNQQLEKLTFENQKEKGNIEIITQSLALRESTNQELATEIADLRAKNTELEKSISSKNADLEKNRISSVNVENEILAIDHKIEENSKKINDDITALANWRNENNQINKNIESTKNRILENQQKLNDTTLNIAEKDKIRTSISDDNSQLITLESDHKKQEKEITQLTNEIENIKNENTNLRKSKEDKGNEIVVLKGEISSQNRAITRLKEKVEYNESEISAKSSLRNKFQLEIESQQSEKSSINTKINANTIAINDYKAESDELSIKIKELETEILELENKLDNIEVENQSLQNENLLLSNEVETMKAEVEKFKPELEQITDELKKEKKRINKLEMELSIDLEKVNELKHDVDSISNYVRRLENPTEDLLLDFVKVCQKNNTDSTLTAYNKITSNSNNNYITEAIMGYYEVFKGNLEKASLHLNTSIKINSSTPKIILLRADVYTRQKNYLAAIKDYDQVLYLDENDKIALIERGKIYLVNLNDRNNGCKDMTSALKKGYFESNPFIQKYCTESANTINNEVHQLTKIATLHSYGYTSENPIKIGQTQGNPNKNITDYLSLLQDSKGEFVTFAKAGRCCPYKTENGVNGEGLLDTYKVYYRDEKGKKTETKLFFTIYDYELPKVPVGFHTEHDIY